jgi:ADP-heptose:LPS heptosyltransferase
MLLSQFPGMQFMVLSAPEDAGIKRTLEKSCKNVLPSHSTRNLYEASCIVSKLSLLITPDTSMVHIGSAVHTPVVGLYHEAPQAIFRFGLYKIPYELVISKTGFVSDIEPAEVSDALTRLMLRNGLE